MNSLTPTYTLGTHRLIHPDQTLSKISPHLKAWGITRCAEVTGLDVDLGVPTYCAIRPAALVLQTSNGKGLTRQSARVSALMEAIELYHAENPAPQHPGRASLKSLTRQGLNTIEPDRLEPNGYQFFANDYIIEWIEGKDLITQEKVWVPASAVYFCEPSLCRTTTNGLASGNHVIEATLHALYELIERDAISGIELDGRLKIKEFCRVIDLATIPDDKLQEVVDKIYSANSKLVLLWVPGSIPVHTFWAVLLNKTPFSRVSTFNIGFGTHLDVTVAAARAITEAVQSRLTLIHASREDIIAKPLYKNIDDPQSSSAFLYFDRLESDTSWQEVEALVTYKNFDLWHSHTYLLSQLRAAGHEQIVCFDLTNPEFDIPVVKIIIPSLRFNRRLL